MNNMKQFVMALIAVLLSAGLLFPAHAATETVTVNYLKMNEAIAVAKSQMSADGRVAALASQRLLILNDDAEHIKKAVLLLQRLDQPAIQYTAYVDIEETKVAKQKSRAVSVSAGNHLGGGWVRAGLDQQSRHQSHKQSFQLRIMANQPGEIEIGSMQPSKREIRQWLSGYGVIESRSNERISLTSGFYIVALPVGEDQVRVRIMPWVKRLSSQIRGSHEILIDLGTTQSPAVPSPPGAAPMRMNAMPGAETQKIIELSGAATEVTITEGETVIIAASSQEAGKFSRALISRHSNIGKRQMTIRLRVLRN